MKAHVDAIKALLVPWHPVHLITVPDNPAMPYYLLWFGGGAPGAEQAIDDVRLDIDSRIGVTMVGANLDAVQITQAHARAALAPGGQPVSLAVSGRIAILRLLSPSPDIAVDRDVTLPTGHPMFGVDVYRLISTPA